MRLFTENMLFDDVEINRVCDQFVASIPKDKEFPDNFVLSGKAAYQLQRGVTSDINNIVFATDDFKTYFNLTEKLKDLGFIDIHKFDKVTEFKYASRTLSVCFELWNIDNISAVVDYKSIALLHADIIDKDLL